MSRRGCSARMLAVCLTGTAIGLGLPMPSLVQAQAASALDVVPGEPHAVPVEQYLGSLVADVGEPGVLDGVRFPITTTLRRAVLPAPVSGVFPARWMGQPVFVVGADVHSQRWLQHNLRPLQAMGALGLVVHAASPAEFKTLQAAGPGLALTPVQANWLAARLQAAGAAVYPLLIQSNGEVRQIVPAPAASTAP